jgi:PPOX class probable F420-dependent enzyme
VNEDVEKAPAWALALLREARVGRLATADAAGRPLVVPVCYVFEGGRCYSAVDAKPKQTRNLRRLRNIAANPQVSLVVDVWDEDWSRLCWVIVEGRAEVLTGGDEFGRAIDRLVAKYPQYRALGLDREQGALVAVTPERVLAWRGASAPSGIRVEAAGAADAPEVMASMRRAFSEYQDTLKPPSSALDEALEDVLAAMARGGAFIARDRGRVVGSARYQFRADYTYCERVSVDRDYRGRGVGAALMRAVEEAAQAAGYAEVRIGVRASLPSNLRFYEDLGYRTLGSQPHPRGPDFDMTLGKDVSPAARWAPRGPVQHPERNN